MTAPAPTACPDCKGKRVFRVGRLWWYCIGCSCDRCGKPNDTPPLCAECARILTGGGVVSFWHYTCEHSQRRIGEAGTLLPLRQLVDADPLARHLSGFRAPLGHIIWLTDLDSPIADALGLTHHRLRCDRTAHRYRVVDYVPMHYPSIRRNLPRYLRDELENAPGAMPSHWYVAYTPVPVVYDPILAAVAHG